MDVGLGLSAGRGIIEVVAITDVDHVGGHTAAGTRGPAVPGPAVVGNQASAAGAESVVLAIALDDGGRVVNANLSVKGERGRNQREHYYCQISESHGASETEVN